MKCQVLYLKVYEKLYGYPLEDSVAAYIEKAVFNPESGI